MADNFPLTPGSGRNAATDEVTYSGDTSDVQLVRVVGVTGSEGSKTVIEAPIETLLTAGLPHKESSPTTATWTSATADETTVSISLVGYAGVLMQVASDGGTCSAGRIVFEARSDASGTWAAYAVVRNVPLLNSVGWRSEEDLTDFDSLALPILYSGPVPGGEFRVRLETPITGTLSLAIRLVGTTASSAWPLTQVVAVGAADDGSAVAGRPVLVAGQDGTNAQTLKTDANGELQVDVLTAPGTAAEGAALPGVFAVVAGDDGTDTQPLQLSAGGDLKVTLDSETVAIASIAAGDNNIGNVDIVTMPDVTVIGKAADGAAVSGNPVLIAGQDGTNVQTLKTDTNGELQVDVLTLPNVTVGTMAALVAGTANIGDVDVLTVPAPLSTTGGGTEATALRVTLANDSTGVVSVDDNGSALTVDNGGTFAVQDSEKVADNAAFTDGTTKVSPAGFIFDETAGTALTENDAGAARMDSKRAQVVVHEDATTRGLRQGVVDETGASAVDAAAVGGGTPHDSVDSGNPVKIGMKAANALPTAVANADRANALSDLWGRQMVTHIDPAQQVWKSANYTAQQTGAAIWDPTAGKKIAITSIVIGSYGTTAARLILWFGANGDTTYSAGTDQLVLAASFTPSTSATPGAVFTPPVPIFCTTADHELHITTDAALSVDVAVYGYEW